MKKNERAMLKILKDFKENKFDEDTAFAEITNLIGTIEDERSSISDLLMPPPEGRAPRYQSLGGCTARVVPALQVKLGVRNSCEGF